MERAGSSKTKPVREELKEREHEATSRDTLKDVAEKEKSAAATTEHEELPSPDGAFDEGRELKDADPM